MAEDASAAEASKAAMVRAEAMLVFTHGLGSSQMGYYGRVFTEVFTGTVLTEKFDQPLIVCCLRRCQVQFVTRRTHQV